MILHSDERVLGEARARARFILADEFQDANFAQIRILSRLAGPEANLFAVGDPDQGIYRFRGASSAAFELFQRSFPSTGFVVLEKNRRSTTPILRTAFAVIDENPAVAAEDSTGARTYQRVPLQSAREEDALKSGQKLASPPVEAVILTSRDAEGANIVSTIRDLQRKIQVQVVGFRNSVPFPLSQGRCRA